MDNPHLETYFFLDYTIQHGRSQVTTHAHLPLWTYARKPYPYEHLRRLDDKSLWRNWRSTVGISLLIGTLPTTENTMPLYLVSTRLQAISLVFLSATSKFTIHCFFKCHKQIYNSNSFAGLLHDIVRVNFIGHSTRNLISTLRFDL